MSSQPIDPLRQDLDEELARALALLHRLSNEAIERINEIMRSLNLHFAEAALRSGAVTQAELDEALEWINQHARTQGRGLIEEVLRRSARAREVTLWEQDQLEPSPRLLLAHDTDHPRSEAVRSLRTELLMIQKGRPGTGIMALVSPCAQEGRSHLAAELAIAFAQLGRRTLLVDADLRQPTQHRLFGADNEIGLAQALTDRGPHLLRGVQGLPQMALMTSGSASRNPLEQLSSGAFERAIGGWRRSFEFIILDTPPATRYSDALAIAAVAGNVLILGRAEATRFADIAEVRRQLSSTQSRVLGAVINRF